MKRLSFAVSLATSMWACDGSNPSLSPTSPSVPAGLGPSYTLSGVVFAVTPTGLAPVEGVRVEEANLRKRATTDQSGFYSVSELLCCSIAVTGSISLRSRKASKPS